MDCCPSFGLFKSYKNLVRVDSDNPPSTPSLLMVDDSFRVLVSIVSSWEPKHIFFLQNPFLDLEVFSPEIHVKLFDGGFSEHKNSM